MLIDGMAGKSGTINAENETEAAGHIHVGTAK